MRRSCMNQNPYRLTIRLFLVAMMLLSATTSSSLAQDGAKTIKSEEYLGQRPGAASGGAATKPADSAKTSKTPPAGNKKKPPAVRNQPGQPVKAAQAAASFVYVVDRNFPEGPPP